MVRNFLKFLDDLGDRENVETGRQDRRLQHGMLGAVEPPEIREASQCTTSASIWTRSPVSSILLTALVIDSSSSTIRNILPRIVLSRQGDFKVWFDRSVSTFPLFSTAEFTTVPDSAIEGEHRYKVQTFSFDRQSGVYRLIDAYITRKAYNVFGSPTPFSVLSKEQSILKARVDKAAHPHGH